MEESEQRLEGFTLIWGLAEGVGVLAVTLVIIWVSQYRGGFCWRSDPKVQFNWHPVLMTLGMIFLYANSIMVYRAFRNNRKHRLKLVHMSIHLMAFLLAVIALQAVFDSHNLNLPTPMSNMYSLHSWVGLTAVILFTCQWLSGLVSFLLPGMPSSVRASLLPVHIFFGLTGFVCAVAAALMGLTEKALWSVDKEYSNFSSEGLMINFIGVTLVVFTCLVVYITTESRYKRLPRPEDEILLTGSME